MGARGFDSRRFFAFQPGGPTSVHRADFRTVPKVTSTSFERCRVVIIHRI